MSSRPLYNDLLGITNKHDTFERLIPCGPKFDKGLVLLIETTFQNNLQGVDDSRAKHALLGKETSNNYTSAIHDTMRHFTFNRGLCQLINQYAYGVANYTLKDPSLYCWGASTFNRFVFVFELPIRSIEFIPGKEQRAALIGLSAKTVAFEYRIPPQPATAAGQLMPPKPDGDDREQVPVNKTIEPDR